jgi:hypothetical protein
MEDRRIDEAGGYPLAMPTAGLVLDPAPPELKALLERRGRARA